MGVTVSGLYVASHVDVYDASQEPINLVGDTCKFAMFTNTITPNFSTDTAYGAAPYNANEVAGAGYTAGGVTLGSKTVSESPAGTMMHDAADAAWSGATFASARCGLEWDDTPTTPVADPAVCLVNFGADYAVTAGVFTVQFSASGIWTVDWTP